MLIVPTPFSPTVVVPVNLPPAKSLEETEPVITYGTAVPVGRLVVDSKKTAFDPKFATGLVLVNK